MASTGVCTNFMKRVLPCFWFLSIIVCSGSSSCLPGWVLDDSTCYGIVQKKLNWTSAEAECVSKHGHLVSIESEAENTVVHNLIGKDCKSILTGLKPESSKDQIQWTDGTDTKWTNNWTPDGKECMKILKSGKWKSVSCSSRIQCYVCETAATTTQATAVIPSLPPCVERNTMNTPSSAMFVLGLKATSWRDATSNCLSKNQTLASLLSQQDENDVLAEINHLDSNHCCKKAGQGWWIGLKQEKNIFEWSDTSKFVNWKSLTTTTNSSYECVMLVRKDEKLQWKLGLCSQGNCFVCKFSGLAVTEMTTLNAMHSPTPTTLSTTTTIVVPITRTADTLGHEVFSSVTKLPTTYPINSQRTTTVVNSTTNVPTLEDNSELSEDSDDSSSRTIGFVSGGACVCLIVVVFVLGFSYSRKTKKRLPVSKESHAGNGGVYRFGNAFSHEIEPQNDLEQGSEMGVDDQSTQAGVYAYVRTSVKNPNQKDGYECVTVNVNNVVWLPEDSQKQNEEGQPARGLPNDTYWQPAKSVEKLYAQFEGKRFRKILISQIQIHEAIGSGEFGTVSKGIWQGTTVAIKMLNSPSRVDRVRFLQEGAIMGQFKHDNIVALCGLILDGEPLMLALEFMENGDLKKYLPTLRQRRGLGSRLLRMAREIAAGMKYLAQKAFIHRDLAVRNVMLDKEFVCKIGDFGLSRDLVDNTYYITSGGRIPIRWTAPEAIMYRKYTLASDVWSYGIVLYEIWTVGRRPYDDSWTNDYIMEMLDEGYRLPPPPGTPYSVYKMMIQCWHPDRHYRPTFDEITNDLGVSDGELLVNGTDVESICGRLGDDVQITSGVYADLQNAYSGTQVVE